MTRPRIRALPRELFLALLIGVALLAAAVALLIVVIFDTLEDDLEPAPLRHS